MRYDVVNQAALFAAPNSELMAAYVDAVMVMSNPDKNTLAHKAVHKRSVSLSFSIILLLLFFNQVFTYRSQSTRILALVSILLLDLTCL